MEPVSAVVDLDVVEHVRLGLRARGKAFTVDRLDLEAVVPALHRRVVGHPPIWRIELPWLDNLARAKRPQRLPTVLTRADGEALLHEVIYTHVLNRGGRGVRSPLDSL